MTTVLRSMLLSGAVLMGFAVAGPTLVAITTTLRRHALPPTNAPPC